MTITSIEDQVGQHVRFNVQYSMIKEGSLTHHRQFKIVFLRINMSRQSQFDSQFLVSETESESDEHPVLHLPEVENSHPETQMLLNNHESHPVLASSSKLVESKGENIGKSMPILASPVQVSKVIKTY